ncbi:hypothetical protein [Stenotrophomonas rhizophila]|uniref:hypothetical protein n=1 Tax=Stenotrophomonas rhizophila TaxID=216778 RepID=UPI0028AE048C|nr:hypothetical protein [Stenotrophomonas rhizophila]
MTDTHNDTASAAEIRIWAVSDCEWFAGAGDAAAILAAYMDHTGLEEDEATSDGQYPRLLTDAELDGMTYTYTDEDELPAEQATFRAALERAIANGEATEAPSLFATTEF